MDSLQGTSRPLDNIQLVIRRGGPEIEELSRPLSAFGGAAIADTDPRNYVHDPLRSLLNIAVGQIHQAHLIKKFARLIKSSGIVTPRA
jgi:hypothetical protein